MQNFLLVKKTIGIVLYVPRECISSFLVKTFYLKELADMRLVTEANDLMGVL